LVNRVKIIYFFQLSCCLVFLFLFFSNSAKKKIFTYGWFKKIRGLDTARVREISLIKFLIAAGLIDCVLIKTIDY